MEDDLDRLKGWAFQTVWPDDLSARDLFDLIQFPKRYDSYGKYELFLIQSQQEVWIKLLAKRFNSQNREHVERLLSLIESEQIPALREAFSSYIDPIELGSTKAQSERKYYLELQKIEIEDAISLGRDVTPYQNLIESFYGNLAALRMMR